MIGTHEPAPVQAAEQRGMATPVSLMLIAAAAFALPLIVGRVLLAAIVAEIGFGVAVGPWLGRVASGGGLRGFLADLGLDLDLVTIGRRGGAITPVTVGVIAPPAVFRMLAAPLPASSRV
jgi:hypothetical protein